MAIMAAARGRLWTVAFVLACVLSAEDGRCAETDQYLVWTIELEDSADALNTYINDRARHFLDRANRRKKPIATCEELTQEWYLYLFQGLHSSRLRKYLQSSDDIDRYPDNSVSYFQYYRMSIYTPDTFPFILPMARTIRVGDVYTGIDKIGHIFGFGRRYFKRYLRYREAGVEVDEAIERMVLVGLIQEMSLVGKITDGIFSHGDMEANFQGFLMARDCCEGDAPYFVREGKTWRLDRPFDMRDYVSPGFDESYDNSHYWSRRKKRTMKRLHELYCGLEESKLVQARFRAYAEYEPSLSQNIIDAYFQEKGKDPQEDQSLHAICSGHSPVAGN